MRAGLLPGRKSADGSGNHRERDATARPFTPHRLATSVSEPARIVSCDTDAVRGRGISVLAGRFLPWHCICRQRPHTSAPSPCLPALFSRSRHGMPRVGDGQEVRALWRPAYPTPRVPVQQHNDKSRNPTRDGTSWPPKDWENRSVSVQRITVMEQ